MICGCSCTTNLHTVPARPELTTPQSGTLSYLPRVLELREDQRLAWVTGSKRMSWVSSEASRSQP